MVGKINKTVFSINLNFYSFLPRRKIIINGKNFSLEADLFKNDIIINEPNSKKIRKFKIDNLYTYKCSINTYCVTNHLYLALIIG